MKSFLAALCLSMLLCGSVFAQPIAQSVLIAPPAQNVAQSPFLRPQKCGMQFMHHAMIAKDPAWQQKLLDQRNSLQDAADFYLQYRAQANDARTASTISPVPVVFHIIVDSSQFLDLGGVAGIKQRCDSQILVLNEDFNHANSDSTMIPTSWKAFYGDAGIHFGLARLDPSGNCSPGYEIMVIPNPKVSSDTGFDDEGDAFGEAKTVGTGLPSWDVTKYYNVWCINFTGGATGLLGLTVPLSQVAGWVPADQEGVCMNYEVLGSVGHANIPPPGTGIWWIQPSYGNNYAWGRTLTHETGHMFEIWHPWGDDDGQCPAWSSDTTVSGITCAPGIGSDDGLSDTPPEANWVYDDPAYNVIPGGTFNDCCMMHGSVNTQPIGIACLSFLDYVDDNDMHLFTPMQAAAMAAMVLVPPTGLAGATGKGGTIGENYNLTQNPALLTPCVLAGIAPSPVEINSSLAVYPNPTIGELHVSLNSAVETLNEIVVINILGQQVFVMQGQGKDYYSIDLSGMSKGIYFVKCNFASGSVIRKILLQ